MRKNVPSIPLLCLIVLVLCAVTPLYADPTDQAIERIKSCTKTAITELGELSVGAETIRTAAEAIDSLDRYYAIITRMINEINNIDKEFSSVVNTKKLHASLAEIKKQTQAAGQLYGAAMGKLPQTILSADEFVAVLQKIKDLSM